MNLKLRFYQIYLVENKVDVQFSLKKKFSVPFDLSIYRVIFIKN